MKKKKKKNKNIRVGGPLIAIEANGNVVVGEPLVALLGVDNLMVVVTKEKVLVMPKEKK